MGQEVKGEGHESLKTLRAWVIALLWVLASSTFVKLRLCRQPIFIISVVHLPLMVRNVMM